MESACETRAYFRTITQFLRTSRGRATTPATTTKPRAALFDGLIARIEGQAS
jgi:hypothetical protein